MRILSFGGVSRETSSEHNCTRSPLCKHNGSTVRWLLLSKTDPLCWARFWFLREFLTLCADISSPQPNFVWPGARFGIPPIEKDLLSKMRSQPAIRFMPPAGNVRGPLFLFLLWKRKRPGVEPHRCTFAIVLSQLLNRTVGSPFQITTTALGCDLVSRCSNPEFDHCR